MAAARSVGAAKGHQVTLIGGCRCAANYVRLAGAEANHGGIVLTQSDYVNQWLTAMVSGDDVTFECPSTTPPAEGCEFLLAND